MSFSGADEIERESWENAERLAPVEDEPEPAPVAVAPTVPDETSDGNDGGDKVFFSPEQRAFLAGLLLGNGEECARAAHAAGLSPDGMVEAVNERALEEFGDILIENTENGYAVIADYIEEVAGWTETK